MRLVFLTCLVLISTGALAQSPKNTKALTAADSELATRCTKAATKAVEAAKRYPMSKVDRDEFILAAVKAMRANDPAGAYVPSEREIFAAKFSMEATLDSGFSPDANGQDMVGHAAATCVIVHYKNW
ncbi:MULTISPECIES: hypothetical protein [unclassified Rhodanobacter]|uniref:Uncharacterized protein n=1 Tax=Rhodanobacter humi TaxID=1888173 RepID=A0ABV4ALG0_9GAMM